jgi:hypothetical protein
MHISDGKLHEVNVLDFVPIEAEAFYVMDRGCCSGNLKDAIYIDRIFIAFGVEPGSPVLFGQAMGQSLLVSI